MKQHKLRDFTSQGAAAIGGFFHFDPKYRGLVLYVLIKDGPSISFCGNTRSSITKSYDSNLRELANFVSQRTQRLGPSDQATASQQYVQGSPLSSLSYKWDRADNVTPYLGFFQLGVLSPQVSYGYGYIEHHCRPHNLNAKRR